MKFEIREKADKKCFVIDLNKDCLKKLKSSLNQNLLLELDKDALNLNERLYGKTKQESIEIQKKNCKKIIKLYSVCVKIVKLLKRNKISFDGVFYATNLAGKRNNNDYMLVSMLDVKFNVGFFRKLSASYLYSATFLDKENSLNDMCDFQEDRCAKHRAFDVKKRTGCCPKNQCKYICEGKCPTWNLACKILMCDYLIDKKGYYFTPHTIPIMRKNFSFLERCFSIGQLCRSRGKALFELWLMRGIGLFVFVFAVAFGCLLIV